MLPSQVIIGTGSGQGIGKAVALGAFAEGAAVAVVDLNAEAAQAVARQILDPGGRAVACPADMSANDSNARVFDRAEAGLGPVAGLVCAGVRRHYAPAELMTDEQRDVVIGRSQAAARAGCRLRFSSFVRGMLGLGCAPDPLMAASMTTAPPAITPPPARGSPPRDGPASPAARRSARRCGRLPDRA